MRRANTNRRTHVASLQHVHRRTPQTSDCWQPPLKSLTTLQSPEVRYHAAMIHGGDGYLRKATDSVGTGMRGVREHI
jgi:hypothetical protein